MSVKTMADVWELDLPMGEKLIALALADHADHDGGNIYPSNATVAWKASCSEDTVIRAKRKLVKAGILVKVKERPGSSSVFRMVTANAPKLPPRKDTPPQIATPPQRAGDTPPQRAGDTPPQIAPPNHQGTTIEPKSAAPAAAATFAKVFVESWSAAYLADRSEKYLFTGGKDGAAVKRLAATGLSADELVGMARRAWKQQGKQFFFCAKAVTIAAFASYFNQVRAELNTRQSGPVGARVATREQLQRDAKTEF